MSADSRFDVTFIRGPRDVSPWKRTSHQMFLRTNSRQIEEDAFHARASYHEQRDEKRGRNGLDLFPNAMYQEKGRKR
jgi:hypothetical protein